MEIDISDLEIIPAAPGKSPVTFNMPITLKRRVGVEAEKRGMRKGDLISQVLVKHLDDYLHSLDSSEVSDKDSHG
jgi:succinate dehydrogenase flavin-adding protein (antitoxin of CptAB toxin-antitoxin module)